MRSIDRTLAHFGKKTEQKMKIKVALVLMMLLISLAARAEVPVGDLLTGVRPGPDGMIDVITVYPHEDDETIFTGGTILKMKEDPRVRVHILCATLGELSGAKNVLHITPEFQGKIRSQELRAAAAVLKADEVIQWDYHDQGLAKADQAELRRKVLDAVNATGAEVVITYGPDGMSGHMDHRTLSKAVTDVFPETKAQRLYYAAMPSSLGHIYKVVNHIGYTQADIAVDIGPYKQLKKLALDEHATQVFFSGSTSTHVESLYDYEWFKLAAENK
jgi:N-acetylglucosamine malate deacetylase 2